MKTMRNVLMLLALLVSVNIVAKPKIRIIATGGTIAGVSSSSTSSAYTAGQVGVQTRLMPFLRCSISLTSLVSSS